jgi:hypothetical protein
MSEIENGEWEEPCGLSEVLIDYEPRSAGRPKKGEEVQHGLDAQFYQSQDALADAGLRPLAEGKERGAVRIQKENSRHRVLVYLFAQGGTAKNVFLDLGGRWDDEKNCAISGTGEYSYQHLLNIRRQPWFQDELLSVIAESGSPLVEAKLKLEMMSSLETLIEVRDNRQEKGATRVAAANSLLDRHLGRPTQKIVAEAPVSVGYYEAERDELIAKKERLLEEMKTLNSAVK